MKLKVNRHVLIPRPETEALAELIIKENKPEQISILDIGTGSGCIAIALKKNIPASKVTALDISRLALRIAKRNANTYGAEIEFIHGDVSKNGSLITLGNYDVIVSNPPYIPPSEKPSLPPNVAAFEPHTALFTPPENPLYFYLLIAEFAFQNLRLNGKLYFEIHENHANEVGNILETNGFHKIEIIKDMQGKNRIVKGKKLTR